MNIKGMIQKAKEKLFGKKSDEEKEAEPQKPYQKEFAEVIAEGTIAADKEQPDGSRTVYAEGGFIEPSEETEVHLEEGEVIVPEEQMKRVLGEVSMEIQLPDDTKATVKQMLQEQEDEGFLILGKEVEKLVAQIIEGLKPCMDALKMAWANVVYIDEPWEIERLKMSNNERRRRGIPMIRRRQYIRIRQNRKKKKKG